MAKGVSIYILLVLIVSDPKLQSIGFTATLKGEKHEPEPKFNKYFTPKDVPYNVYDLVEPEG